MIDGLLLVDKPSGWTSFDAVNKIRSLIAQQSGLPVKRLKVGHTGTLDPLATGLLIVTVGNYCKRAQEFMKLDKRYNAIITLGAVSETDDSEGKLTLISEIKPVKPVVKTTLDSFVGQQMQVPPQYSAIKLQGQRAYHRARKGLATELSPRHIEVLSIKNINYEYPIITADFEVSSGTYIRALARDIGQKLGTGAYLSGLRRTRVGQFSVSDARTINELSTHSIQDMFIRA